jgi:hypothetical protein
MIDGLVERSIRRYSGRRVSATLHDRARYAIAGVVGLSLFVYACVPKTFELQCGSWAMAAGIGVLSRLQWKYLQEVRLIGRRWPRVTGASEQVV